LQAGETSTGSEFGPGCSGGPPGPFDVRPLGDGSWGVYASYDNFPAGRYGQGMNLTHLTKAVTGGGVAYWAGFNDDEPRLGDEPPGTAPPPPAALGRLSIGQ